MMIGHWQIALILVPGLASMLEQFCTSADWRTRLVFVRAGTVHSDSCTAARIGTF
jgi:hypothetical protein